MYTDLERGAIERIRSAPTSLVTRSTTSKVAGSYVIVNEAPETLARLAALDLDTYALARMIASENGSEPAEYLLALAECARNYCARSGTSIARKLLYARVADASGKFGEQAAGRWASTRLDPNYRHVQAAQEALLANTNFVDGADDFFDPRSQDSGTQGTHTLRLTSEKYIADRYAEGRQWVGPLPGINPYRLMMFARGAGTDVSDALAILESGRDYGGEAPPGDVPGLPTGIGGGNGVLLATIGAGGLLALHLMGVL